MGATDFESKFGFDLGCQRLVKFDHVSAVKELSKMGMKRGYDNFRWLVLVPIFCVFKHPSTNDPMIIDYYYPILIFLSNFAPL